MICNFKSRDDNKMSTCNKCNTESNPNLVHPVLNILHNISHDQLLSPYRLLKLSLVIDWMFSYCLARFVFAVVTKVH